MIVHAKTRTMAGPLFNHRRPHCGQAKQMSQGGSLNE